jgi:hypothetical protein
VSKNANQEDNAHTNLHFLKVLNAAQKSNLTGLDINKEQLFKLRNYFLAKAHGASSLSSYDLAVRSLDYF